VRGDKEHPLTDDVDRYGGMALYSGVPIEVEPVV
jgi:hypothetical protein